MGLFGITRTTHTFPEEEKKKHRCAAPSRNRRKPTEYTEEERRANFCDAPVAKKDKHRRHHSEEVEEGIAYTENTHREFKKSSRIQDNHQVAAPRRNRKGHAKVEMTEEDRRYCTVSKEELERTKRERRKKEEAKGSHYYSDNSHRR